MAGKGDKWRKDVDYQKYWTNYPELSGQKQEAAKKVVKLKNGKTRYIFG